MGPCNHCDYILLLLLFWCWLQSKSIHIVTGLLDFHLFGFDHSTNANITMYMQIWPSEFIYGKNINSGSYNWTIQLKYLFFCPVQSYLHLEIVAGNAVYTFIFLHFELDCSVVRTWIDIFFMDELWGSYLPVHGDYWLGFECFKTLYVCVQHIKTYVSLGTPNPFVVCSLYVHFVLKLQLDSNEVYEFRPKWCKHWDRKYMYLN